MIGNKAKEMNELYKIQIKHSKSDKQFNFLTYAINRTQDIMDLCEEQMKQYEYTDEKEYE